MAKQLEAPVLLVIDAGGMARSVAAMAIGYARFDPKLRVAGVLFNRISGERHYGLLKAAIEAETDLAVVGYLRRDGTLALGDRHLGLITAIEQGAHEVYDRLGQAAAQTVDLDRVEALAGMAPEWLPTSAATLPSESARGPRVRVAVAYDAAFCFYYPENLELLEAKGAELVRFSPMRDETLPDADLLYLGGGYPELHAELLSKNVPMRTAIRRFAENGGRLYAECGGMMYLTQGIRDFDGRSHQMVGLFPAEAVMKRPGLVLGYREIEMTRRCLLGEPGTKARGHEFHYSQLLPGGDIEYAWTLRDAHGRAVGQDGLVRGNVLAAYTHLHFASRPELAQSLLESPPAKH